MKGNRVPRKLAEDTLRESEERLSLMVAHCPNTVFYQNGDLRYIWIINPPAPFTEEQVVGKTDFDLFDKDEARQLTEHKKKILETGVGTRGEFHLVLDGVEYYYDAVYEPSKDSEGHIVGVLGYVRDITERKRTDEELRKARDELERRVKERTAELAEANEELRLEIAQRQRAQEALQARERQQAVVAELGQQALAGTDISTLMDKAVAFLAQTLQVEYAKVLELLPDGSALLLRAGVGWKKGYVGHATVGAGTDSQAGYTLLSKTPLIVQDLRTETRFSTPPLMREHGVVSGMSVIISGRDGPFGILGAHTTRRRTFTEDDIHFLQATANVLAMAIERRRGDEERERLLVEVEHLANVAQRRAAELQGVLNNMVDGVFTCDREECITLANEAGLHLLGLASFEDVKRCALAEFIELLRIRHPDGKSFAREELPLVCALGGQTIVQEQEIIYNRKTQRDVFLRVSAAPIRDETGKIVGAVEVDSDVTELTELDRLKDEFISVAAHELKTPVAVMKGYAQALLRAREEVAPPKRKMLDAIDRGADRIDRIVKDLLDISRLYLGQMELTLERVDLPEMVEEVVDRMALTTTKHRIQIVRSEPVVIQGDRDRLEQVLINLIDNAIKYSPKGGDIDVAVLVRDREAIVSVRDYGVGIPREKQPHIFERFYRAHTGTPYDYGGMGVGLYISKEIIRRQSGRMWFESEEGRGSTFYFSLPLYQHS